MKKHVIHNLTSTQFDKTVTYFKVCSESQRRCVLQLHHLKRGSVRNVSKSSNKKKMVKLQCTTLTLSFLPKVGHFKRRLRNDSLLEVASSGKLRNCSFVTSAVGWVKYLSVSKTTRNRYPILVLMIKLNYHNSQITYLTMLRLNTNAVSKMVCPMLGNVLFVSDDCHVFSWKLQVKVCN